MHEGYTLQLAHSETLEDNGDGKHWRLSIYADF